ncbi:MAG: hypothetical protein ACK5RP_04610 [Betaproteobacteria bacterium]|jgi:hypothetical protein
MHPDYVRDMERICADALDAAQSRTLTGDEVAALRWAAGIPEGTPRPMNSGNKE